jgi:hypothetical protein
MSAYGYQFDPNLPQPKRIVRCKSAWEEYTRATAVFAGFPSAGQTLQEWVPGYFYPNGVQFQEILIPRSRIREEGFLELTESVVSTGSAIALFATVSGMPTALVFASSQLLR